MLEKLNDYQAEAAKTIPANFDGKTMIDNAVYGLCGEVGELVDRLKKVKFQGHPEDKEHLIFELGDILWYVAEMATGAGISLQDVASQNIWKLRQRYGEKFDSDKSVNRKDNM